MWRDPIVEQVRRVRDEYARRFDYDIDRIVADLIAKQEARKAGEKASSGSTQKPSGKVTRRRGKAA